MPVANPASARDQLVAKLAQELGWVSAEAVEESRGKQAAAPPPARDLAWWMKRLGHLSAQLHLRLQEQVELQWRRRPEGSVLRDEFKLVRELGEGSFGVVWLADQFKLSRRVAIKFMSWRYVEDREFVRRFEREAEAAARLKHPNAVQVLTIGEDAGRPFLVMEYVEGENLQTLLERGKRLSVGECVELGRAVAAALVAAHAVGLVHRDVKPENIFRTRAGEVKLGDFGLVKVDAASTLTLDHVALGTPLYMPPEQQRDAAAVDLRADLYALGGTLFHLLTGRPPYVAAGAFDVMKLHREAAIPSAREAEPPVPVELDAILRRLLAKRPEDRFQRASEVVEALSGLGVVQVLDSTGTAGRQDAASQAAHVASTMVLPRPEGAAPARVPEPSERVHGEPPVRQPARDLLEDPSQATPLRERIELAERLGRSGDPRLGATPMDIPLVEVPGGRSRIGLDTSPWDGEQPEHEVEVAAFRIGRFPITNQQYHAFVAAKRHRQPDPQVIVGAYRVWENGRPSINRLTHPVVGVAWRDAVAYCRWISEVTGRPHRLPTEAEWERAARGTDGREFPWGNEWREGLANESSLGLGGTTPVGVFPAGASPSECLDMAGNVWEWCSSLYRKYPYDARDGREDAAAGGARVLRGGAWDSGSLLVRAACRGDIAPGARSDRVGFRVVVGAGV
ncbi:MAG: SUMF1/EgtB/PvdO family nonheme iron enzyme [Planctomycetes bacterium]|nr:SUMF1/EgtB/PvdO family nonheme iron enzyme [Planctomycetota bacterium]